MANELDESLGNFMQITAKSTVAVIVPMFGYSTDIENNPVNGEVLNAVLPRLYSNIHHLYFIFVSDPKAIKHDKDDERDPHSIVNIILGKVAGGNVLNIAVPPKAVYSDYIKRGMDAALNDTNAQFVVVFNPWVLLQDAAIDVLVDRANYGDEAKVISGFDLRSVISPEAFDTYRPTVPREDYAISADFLGMPRYVAQMIKIDTQFKTHQFMERDIWQQMVNQGFSVISSQRIPIFPFDFPWSMYEPYEAFQADGQRFSKKWGFNPGLKYTYYEPKEE